MTPDTPFVSLYQEPEPEIFCLTECDKATICSRFRSKCSHGRYAYYKPDPDGNCDHLKPRGEK